MRPIVLLCDIKDHWGPFLFTPEHSALEQETSDQILRLIQVAHDTHNNQVYYTREAAIHIEVDQENKREINMVYTTNYESEQFLWLNKDAQELFGDRINVRSKPLFTLQGRGHRPLTDNEFCKRAMLSWF